MNVARKFVLSLLLISCMGFVNLVLSGVNSNDVELTPNYSFADSSIKNSNIKNEKSYQNAEEALIKKNYTKALSLYKQILNNDQYNADALAGIGAVHHRLGDYNTAIHYYDKALQLNHSNPYYLSDKGNALLSLGNIEKAKEYLQQALVIKPDFVDALNGMANLFERNENYRKALTYRSAVLITDPQNQEAMVGKANVYSKTGLYGKAIATYDKVLSLTPDNINAIIGKANVNRLQGNYDKALAYYQDALKKGNISKVQRINALQGKAETYVKSGEYEKGEALLEEIRKIEREGEKYSIVMEKENGADKPANSEGSDYYKEGKRNNNKYAKESHLIPEWVRELFGWFYQGKISESEMIRALEFIVDRGIITLKT